ncbi:antitoxin VbhA family protein [Sporosarcina gallistercoris]|uniref:Antitoxin VbhA family protein n=1 Tax=Sporosarcina gallistercoris TaxID=2762245 RepID=A0ABR8PK30_9BACL|nr:antitoxin VbhA family protein [Sporosarcina gallistercoris]MBD7908511.1 antitoxin VbhA family protein [Sporosarcina gallistercoris]
MNANSRIERQRQVEFAVGMASIDGGKPSVFTKNLLKQYEEGQLSSSQLKQAIVEKYTRAKQ